MRVLIASLVHLATAQDLVAPGGLARSGGRRDMRAGAGSFRTPSGPAVGFFVDGSSIEDLNGVYARLERAPACLRCMARKFAVSEQTPLPSAPHALWPQ